jgi:hypothetical protein
MKNHKRWFIVQVVDAKWEIASPIMASKKECEEHLKALNDKKRFLKFPEICSTFRAW